MAAIAGKGGSVKQGASALAFVESWEMSIANEALESTGLGATSRSYVGLGLPTNTGTVNFRALDNSDTGTAAVRAAALAGTELALDLYESSTKYWDCQVIITAFSQSTGVDGLVTGSFGFTITGTPTYT
jgi:hypothetical protein